MVAAAFLADGVNVELAMILLCMVMLLVTRDFKVNKPVSAIAALLGIMAAVLTLPEQAETHALNIELWAIIGLLVGRGSSFHHPLVCAPGQLHQSREGAQQKIALNSASSPDSS